MKRKMFGFLGVALVLLLGCTKAPDKPSTPPKEPPQKVEQSTTPNPAKPAIERKQPQASIEHTPVGQAPVPEESGLTLPAATVQEGTVEAVNSTPTAVPEQSADTGVYSEPSPVIAKGNQTTCPVSGKPFNNKIFCDYDGRRIYFADDDAQMNFESEPDKYVKKMEDAGVVFDKAPLKH